MFLTVTCTRHIRRHLWYTVEIVIHQHNLRCYAPSLNSRILIHRGYLESSPGRSSIEVLMAIQFSSSQFDS
jgi:hypothetical protein